jgi:trimethylamine--corrinoid protein Co-methyltransferase
MVNLQAIRPTLRLDVLSHDQLKGIQAATLDILAHVGVCFPSERALAVFAEHGAQVDAERQIVKLPRNLVSKAVDRAPRTYVLGGRKGEADLLIDGATCYMATDGCGVQTVDFQTGERRPSRKEDVARMARVADSLSSISFYWPMVSAQDYGRTAPLHELDASFRNTVKHVQTETAMGEMSARYAVRMGEVIAGTGRVMRQRPPFSVLICTIAPLAQDKEGIEAAMVYAEAGIPVGFMAMPNMGATAPATPGGALVVGNAEVVSAMVLMQLVAPGAPVFHSILASVMDPHTAEYIVSIPQKYLCNAAAVQLAHDWGVPALAGAFGMDARECASWQQGRDNVYTSLLVPMAGADLMTGSGLLEASTLLVPEQIILDDDIYHTNRVLVEGIDVEPESLAIDVITDVGPRGHFLAHKHTRGHLREIWIPELTHPRQAPGGEPSPNLRERARATLNAILKDHQPDQLDGAVQVELRSILEAAEGEL